MAKEQDILKMPAPKHPPKLTSRRIGIHTSSGGGVENAAERAYRLGCNTFQIFSSSPRQWAPYELGRPQCEQMSRLRDKYDLKPLVIHTNYLVNLASTTRAFLKKSIEAFRGEIERALALCAEYLVLHPGSFKGTDREKGILLGCVGCHTLERAMRSPHDADTFMEVVLPRMQAYVNQSIPAHPQLRRVSVRRKLPGTLVVDIDENLPVALVATNEGVRAYDARGVALPIDLARTPIDAPGPRTRHPGALKKSSGRCASYTRS